MTIEEIRQEWLRLSEKMTADVMQKYHKQHQGSAGHEGLGIYGIYQERIARKKVQIAVKLLERHGHEPTTANIHKVTKQNRRLIERYLPVHVWEARAKQKLSTIPESELATAIPFNKTGQEQG